jgi:putative ABC transport system permease protein
MNRIREGLGEALAACVEPGWLQDFRHALRSLSRAWGFTLTIIGLLGIGLGLTTAIFSIFYGILLRPFPYTSPDRLVRVDWMMPTGQSQGSSLGDLALWIEGARGVSGIGVFSATSTEVRAGGSAPAETVQVTYVSSATLSMLGVHPHLGRLFDANEDKANGDVHKAILSYALWTRTFGQDPNVIGRVLQQGESHLEIVGVMPAGFGFPARTELWVPVESFWLQNNLSTSRRATVRIYSVLARLVPEADPHRLRDELQVLSDRAALKPIDGALRVRTLRDAETGELRPYLLALLGGVACLALICIANVSGLQLARGTSRYREFAVRAAIGASAGRNMRVPFAESLVLSAAGAFAAALVAVATLRLMLSSVPVPLPSWMRLDVDVIALLFCVALAGIAAVLSGLVPAWRAMGQGGQTLLRSGSRGTADRAGLRKGLVIAEIALSTMLLVSACLLIQTLFELQKREPGFRPQGVLTAKISRAQAGSTEQRASMLGALHARVLDRVKALPGVVSVAASNRVPFASGANARTVADLHVSGTDDTGQVRASFFGSRDITPEYFATMGIPLLRGRTFDTHDTLDGARVVIINDRAAAQLWPNRDPLGQQVTWGTPRPDNPPATVVGIVGNVRDVAAEADRGLEFYYPYAQFPDNALFYVIRTSVDPGSLIASVRQAIVGTEPTIAVSSIKTMPQWIDESLWQTRLWGRLFGFFAASALLLSAAGLYGLVSYLVALRSKEMVIRMSIGATGTQIATLVLGGMLRLIIAGIVAGVIASITASRLIASLLFQVSATDVRIYSLVSVLVAGVTLLACCPPILRTSRVNVLSILKEDQ